MAESVDELDLTPPQAAQENAQQVLDWRDEHGEDVQGMTRTGWVRANQLANGEELSPDIVKRMAQFNRHRENGQLDDEHRGEPWRDAGYVAWLGWGGDEGIDWAMRMAERIDSLENTGQDTLVSLSHKHKNVDKKDGTMREKDTFTNRDLIAEIRGEEVEGDRHIDASTYKGYINGLDFEDENWRDSVERLREVHGMIRRFMSHVAEHHETGHGRAEEVPFFDDKISGDTFNEFVENMKESDDFNDDTFIKYAEDISRFYEDLQKVMYQTIIHDNNMHDREEQIEQLLSETSEEMFNTVDECIDELMDEGLEFQEAISECRDEMGLSSELDDSYDDMSDCISSHVDEGFEQDEAVAICEGKMTDVEMEFQDFKDFIEDVHFMDETSFSEGDLVRWDSSGGLAYGQVEDVERDGVISAEPEGPDMEGTEDDPAYGIRVYDLEEGEWVPTDTYVVHRADSLTGIDNFPDQRANSETLNEGIMPTHGPLDDFGTTESQDWSRPAYSEFANAYDLDDRFADLSNDEKRLVAAHFGRVDASSYDDAAYSDLQLPHHDPSTGDVDRAGVIAARQRLQQSDIPQSDLEAIDTHLAGHLRDDFDEEEVSRVTEENEERNSDEDDEYTQEQYENGQLVSFETDYGRNYGRVKDRVDGDYVVEVYTAKLGGGWIASGKNQVYSSEKLSKEHRFPDSMHDVFNEGASGSRSSPSAETVQENSEEDKDSETVENSDGSVTEDLSPSEIQQVGKKVKSVAQVLEDDRLEDYLDRNDMDYSAEEFRALLEKF